MTARPPSDRAPRLVVALGNPLAGDDGVGVRVLRLLHEAGALGEGTDMLNAGTDLLAWGSRLGGRATIVLVDATAGLPPGVVRRVAHDPEAHDMRQAGAHTLSAAAALELLKLSDRSLAHARCTWVLIGIESVRPGEQLTPRVETALHVAAREVISALHET